MSNSEEFYKMIFSIAKSSAAYANTIKDCTTQKEKEDLEKEALSYVRSSYTRAIQSYPEQVESEEELQELILRSMENYLSLGKD